MNFIWATRGRTWGFRFLRRGGFEDPLGVYEEAFSGAEELSEVCRRTAGRLALRFPDPLERRDAAGRVIPHDFVLLDSVPDDLDTVADGLRLVWPLVADEFEHVWSLPDPPQRSH